MPEHKIVTRLRELMALGLTAEEAYTVHFGLAAAHMADVQAGVQAAKKPDPTKRYAPTAAVQVLGDTGVQARLRSEAARVFEATGTDTLHELFAFLDAGT
jgi:hypothetical protein